MDDRAINWSKLEAKCSTPWEALRRDHSEQTIFVVGMAALEELSKRQAEMPAGWANRVVASEDFEIAFDSHRQVFIAVFAGEELLKMTAAEVAERVNRGDGDIGTAR